VLRLVVGLALGIWLGMKAEQYLQVQRCLDSGGLADMRGFCVGPAPR
jgi:hypothetical protein